MRKLLKVHQDGQTLPDKSSEESSPDSPHPSKRRRLTSKTTCTVTKPEAKVISWADGITDSAAIDPYVFRSLTPSPVLPHQYQPPTPTSTHSPISTQDQATSTTDLTTTSAIPGNNLMSTIAEIKQQVTSLNNRYITQELATEQLKKQNERLILLVQNLVEKPSQPTATPISFTPHRPWDNLTSICTPTRPPRQLLPPSIPTDHTASPLSNLQPDRRSSFLRHEWCHQTACSPPWTRHFSTFQHNTAYLHQTLSGSKTLHQDLATTQNIW